MKIAIIGSGRMGRRHIQVARQAGLEVVGICDASEEALALAVKEQQVKPEQTFFDANKLFEQTHPDCVIVATTAPSHCEYTRRAIEHGAKFILCEKPMAVSLQECDQMISVCKKAGARLAINHQMRFMDQYIEPKRLINSAAFGGLSSVTAIAGNFGMAMNGTHYFEMFRFLTDEVPLNASAWFSSSTVPNPRGAQFEDRAGAVRLATESGKSFYLEANNNQGHGLHIIYAGRNGQIFIDELTGLMRWVVREEQYRSLPTTRYGMPCIEESKKIPPADAVAPSKSVLQALIENRNFPTAEDGRTAVASLVAAYVSNEQNHVAVSIDDKLPLDRVFPWA